METISFCAISTQETDIKNWQKALQHAVFYGILAMKCGQFLSFCII
jgi:hypothetical protein